MFTCRFKTESFPHPDPLGWGIHVNPRLIHVYVWQKPLQYCKVISLQLIEINEKIKKLKKNKLNIQKAKKKQDWVFKCFSVCESFTDVYHSPSTEIFSVITM